MPTQQFSTTVSLKEGLYAEAVTRGLIIGMDEPEQLGGTNKGMNPVEILLSALGGCLTITTAMFSKSARVDIKDCKVEVIGDLDPEGFMGVNKEVRKGFSEIRYNIEIVTDAPEEKVNKLIKMVEDRCPVSDTLQGVKVVNESINIKRP